MVKKTKESPPPTHNLHQLAKRGGVGLSEEQALLLDEINKFNIKARYNDVKFRFYKKATREYARKYLKKSTRLYLWLKKKV